MAGEDIPVPALTMVLIIHSHEMDSGSRYHSFEFVSINYIPKLELS